MIKRHSLALIRVAFVCSALLSQASTAQGREIAPLATLLSQSSGTVKLDQGTYTVDLADGKPLRLQAGTVLAGEGPSSVIEVSTTGDPNAVHTLFSIANSDITIRNLKIRVAHQEAGGSLVFFALGGGASNFDLENVDIDGGVLIDRGHLNWTVHVVRPTPGEDFSEFSMRNSRITRVNRAFFRDGTPQDTGRLRGFRFIGNRFSNQFRTPISLNSPFAVFDDVTISGNTFIDNFAKTTGGDTAALLALGSANNVRVTDNHLSGVADGIHIEEKAHAQIIRGNTIDLKKPGGQFGIRLVDNKIGGSVSQPSDVVIEGNIIRGPGRSGVGILQANTGRSTGRWLNISDNIVSGWQRGIQVNNQAEGETAVVANNQIYDSEICLWATQPLTSVANNWLAACDVGFHVRRGGIFGANRFYNVKIWGVSDSGKISLTGWETVINARALRGKTAFDLAPLGSEMSGSLLLGVQGLGRELQLTREIRWDGHLLAADKADRMMLTNNSGRLSIQVDVGPAAAGAGRVQAVFRGLHTLN